MKKSLLKALSPRHHTRLALAVFALFSLSSRHIEEASRSSSTRHC
jgi:hypothetical protein